MRKSAIPSVFVLLAIWVSNAWSQETLGALLDAGATKLTGDAWRAQLPITFGGIDFTGGVDFTFTYKADGSFSGNAVGTHGEGSSGSFGKWTMDGNGRHCIDETLSAWNMRWDECFYVYKIGDRYFATQNDSDRSARAMQRRFKSQR